MWSLFWRAGIKGKGELRHTAAHVIDIAPTVLALAGVEKPKEWEGEVIPEAPGKSLVSALQGDVEIKRECLWWLHGGNRALRVGDWKLVAAKGDPWELYDLKGDRAEQHNLAAKNSGKVKEMSAQWEAETARMVEVAKKAEGEGKK